MAPIIRVDEVALFERPVRFRMPFRFGVARVEQTAQAFVRLRVTDADGRSAVGWSAEMMMPKWFDKSPELTPEDNVAQLRQSLRLAADGTLAAKPGTAFARHAEIEPKHHQAAADAGLNGLIASFGLALLDRAVIDGLCRLAELPVVEAVRSNLLGIDARTAPELEGFDLDAFLAARPMPETIAARHTVGLGDVLTGAATLDDGLPDTLEEVINRYGHRWFKLKLGGDPEADVARLVQIAEVLDRMVPEYQATLDGNEQYAGPEAVLELLDRMAREPALATLRSRVLFLEQPIARARALETDMSQVAWRIGLEIDESDADIGAFPAALKLGYRGISSKSCKGFYRSLLNMARVEQARAGGVDAFLSAEDLTTQAGIGLQQDLALAAMAGATHIERNGHHYVDGMAGAPEAEQQAFLDHHGDLYVEADGRARLRIADGEISLRTVGQSVGLGAAVAPDWTQMIPLGGED
ncbi:mandelate racemase [Devosia sp.]|uniref:mandelate racemase n=1 Tax=Devosia sp. TaxID=1871048 RepID=UPI003A93F4F5